MTAPRDSLSSALAGKLTTIADLSVAVGNTVEAKDLMVTLVR